MIKAKESKEYEMENVLKELKEKKNNDTNKK